MRTRHLLTLLALGAPILTSCQSQVSSKASVSDDSVPTLAPYDGPRATIALRKFDWKVGQQGGGVTVTGPDGQVMSWTVHQSSGIVGGLEDLLTHALQRSNRYWVMERMQFDQIKDEVGLKEDGWIQEGSGPVKGTAEGAELAVYASVTEWNPDAGGRSIGGGLASAGLGLIGLGGAKVDKTKGVCEIHIRLIDMSSSRVLATEVVRGEATSSSFRLGALGFGGGLGAAGGLSEYADTPMGAAIQKAIALAVEKIVERTPHEFYRHS